MEKLTPRQQAVLDCIRRHMQSTGYPPTRAEIAKELGFKSPNAAEDHLKTLARKGAIELLNGTSRGIRLLDEAEDVPDGLPIIGQVAAGSPILAEQHIDSYADLPPSMFRPSADYMLRVKGDSMIDAGIFDGDLVAVKRKRQANNGEIVVARLEDEVTVKRFQKKRNKVLLVAENEDYAPIEVGESDPELTIEGLVVGVLRTDV